MRGFFGGLLSGLVVCGGALVAVSVLAPLAPPPGVDPDAEQLDIPSADEVSLDQGETDPDIDTQVPVSPVPLDPDPADLGNLPNPDQTLVPEPELSTEATPLRPPEGSTALAGRPAAELPVEPAERPAQVTAQIEQDSAIQAETGVPAAPMVPTGTDIDVAMPVGAAGQGADIDIATNDAPLIEAAPQAIPSEPEPEAAPDAVTMPVPADAVTNVPQPSAVAEAEQPEVPAQESDVVRTPQVGAVPIPEVDRSIEAVDNREGTPLPQVGGADQPDRPMIGERVIPLTDRDNPVEDDTTGVTTEPALARFSQPFDNPQSKPLLSIVLIDDGQAQGSGTLPQFPFPVTIAIDPARSGAAEDMMRYRRSGHEILALVDLPQNFTAADTEVSLSAGMNILNQAVGLLEGAGMQAGQDQAAQLVAFSKGGGFGVITRPVGLNMTRRLAEQIDVPTAPVFRDFGGENLDRGRMRRFLEAAIVRADQDGAAIVVGRLRPETLTTLESWSGQARADRVALAPVSAVLEQESAAH